MLICDVYKLKATWRALKYCALLIEIPRIQPTVYRLSCVEKEAHAFIRNFSYTKIPISLKYSKIKSLLLARVRPVNFEARERAHFHNLIRNLIKIFGVSYCKHSKI